jgi:hypothetical protein
MPEITVILKTAQGSFQLEKATFTLDVNGKKRWRERLF